MSYFKPEEMRCKCGRPECDAPPMKMDFMGKLNMLRQLWGKPLVVTSGSRCAHHNQAVGGAPESEHTKGNAADLKIASYLSGESLAALAEKVGLMGIGVATNFVHVDNGAIKRRWDYPPKAEKK